MEETGPVTFDIPEGDSDGMILGDPLPFLILSHLCRTPLGLIDPGEHIELAFWHTLLYVLASVKGPLFRIENGSLRTQSGIGMWDLHGVGSLIEQKEGVVEPIVQSLSQGILARSESIQYVYERAVSEGNIFVMWRIHMASLAVKPLLRPAESNWTEWLEARFNDDFRPLLRSQREAGSRKIDSDHSEESTVEDPDPIDGETGRNSG